jgi:hypothetical protein
VNRKYINNQWANADIANHVVDIINIMVVHIREMILKLLIMDLEKIALVIRAILNMEHNYAANPNQFVNFVDHAEETILQKMVDFH